MPLLITEKYSDAGNAIRQEVSLGFEVMSSMLMPRGATPRVEPA